MTITIYDDYIVHANQTLVVDLAGALYGFVFDHVGRTDLRFVNLGTVEISGFDPIGFSDSSYTYGLQSIIWNRAGGQLSVVGDNSATGFDLQDSVGTFFNDGALTVSSAGRSIGGILSNEGHFANTGTIDVSGDQAVGLQLNYLTDARNSGGIAAHGVDSAIGLSVQSNDVTFHNEGTIAADTTQGQAIGIDFGYVALLENAGQILASGPDSIAVQLMPEYWKPSDIANSGLIRGATAILALAPGSYTPRPISIDNSGRIVGDITLVSGADDIHNTGLIRGAIALGDGKDVYDGSHGRLLGSVDGGDGDDQLTGGKKGEVLIGGAGADDLTGGRGADAFVFQRLSDSSTARADLIHDLATADVIDLSQIDADRTLAGDQAFTLVSSLDGRAGEISLSYRPSDGVTLLEADVDGDGVADMTVRIAGDHADFTHFVL